MPMTLEELDAIMETASRALADMDYLTCESLCLLALDEARNAGRFGYYASILLPLQEARRQRRILAATGNVQLGSGDAGFDPARWLAGRSAGCIVLTHPHSAEYAMSLIETARLDKQYIEVLFADNVQDDPIWTLRSYDGPKVSCTVSAPTKENDSTQWFIDATERLGDAAIQSVDNALRGVSLVDALEARLRVFPDHELLHQRLADAARAVR